MRQPNILFLLSDEHSFRFMGHANDPEPVHTPNFDRLAAQGTVFANTYCQMALCTPSRLCMLTGREVRGAGAWRNEAVLRPAMPTIASVLGTAGYATCLIGKMHLGGRNQFAGFQHRPYGDLTGRTGHQWEPLRDPPGGNATRERTLDAGITEIPESLLQENVVAQETVAWLREQQVAQPDQPWFLMASFSRPHFPLTAPARWFNRYYPDNVTEPRIPPGGDAYVHPMSVGARRGFRTDEIDPAELRRARAAYFACVSYLDEIIGDLMLRLETTGLLENTIIVYTSDHGEMAGEHGMWWKHTWHEASTRVPLIISTPEQRREMQAARTVRVPVALIDLFPTLATLGGAVLPDDLDGVSLADSVRGSDNPPEARPIISDNLIPRWGAGTEYRMVRWQQYKYVHFRAAQPLMFDLAADPHEQHDLLRRGAPEAARSAMRFLADFARSTIDFDAAEAERNAPGGDLATAYALNVPRGTPNQYHMPNGSVVNADDPVYSPTVLTRDPATDLGAPPA